VRLLVDSAERHGIARADLLRGVETDSARVLADAGRLEWNTIVTIFETLSELVGGDRDALRTIARDMRHSKAPDVVREAARGILTPRGLYEFMDRWMVPAFPHMRLYQRFLNNRRMILRAEIPEPYAECAPFFYVLEARLAGLTEMMGLAPCIIVESRINARRAECVFDLPTDASIVGRARRTARSLLAQHSKSAALEAQRRFLEENIDALRRASDELRGVLDRLPDLACVHSEGRIVWANQVLVDTLGYGHVAELLGRRVLDIVAPQSRAELAEKMTQPTEALRREPLLMIYGLTRTGEEVAVEAAPPQSVVFDGVTARLIVMRDVTDRVRMQQKLIAADRLASMGLLAAGVAHEVNNPLAYVLNNIEIARKAIANLGPEANTGRAALGVALEGVDRIRTIVHDLLLLSRSDDDVATPLEVANIVRSTLTLAAQEVERTAQLVATFETAPLVRASGSRIAQVLLNLVSNALEAMRGRSRDRNVLRVRVGRAKDGRLLLEVSDTGVGIAPSDVDRIFEPFFTTRADGQGTGLGLPIAQRLVLDMGGEIFVTSRVGEGTTFRVLLPGLTSDERAPCAKSVERGDLLGT